MLNKLALAATVTATVAGAAYAQQPTAPNTNPPPPAAVTPAPTTPNTTTTLPAAPNSTVQTITVPDTAGDKVLTNLPPNAMTVTNYYKQNLYDPSDTKIGEVSDVLVDKNGKVDALIVSVGGFLGIGEKDVAVPFDAVHGTEKNGKWYLTMNTTKDALKNAPGFKYDRVRATWIPA